MLICVILLTEKLVVKKSKYLGECEKCGKRYERIGCLKTHQKLCNAQFYECALCPYRTIYQVKFQDHLGNHILGKAYKTQKIRTMKKKKPQKRFCKYSFYYNYLCFVEMYIIVYIFGQLK